MEYMNVTVDGMSRRYPTKYVKMRWKPREHDESVRVAVLYPSYRIEGTIALKDMEYLVEYGKRNDIKVWTGEDDFAQMVLDIQDLKYGKPKETDDEITRQLRRAFSQTPE